jgi:2-polyprenyl-6-hydroxyphenyl methylase/3-demethylubiquinone-9 3-methyltransferase
MDMTPQEKISAISCYFDQQAAQWTQKYRRDGHFRERLATVVEWFKDQPRGLKLLDYGCGSGVLLAELVHAGHIVTGVDVSAGMLASARRALEAAAEPAERYTFELVGDDFRGEYLNQTYDGIICLGVLEYLDRPEELITTLLSRLVPGGLMILSFPNRSSVLRKVEWFVFKFPFLFRPCGLFPHLTALDSYLKFQKHQFTVEEIEELLREGKLSLERIRYHIAHPMLARLTRHPAFAMSVIAEFRKQTASER